MKKDFFSSLKKLRLDFPSQSPWVLACSGGGDSTALVLAVEKMRKETHDEFPVYLAFFQHGQKKKNGCRKERDFCKSLALQCRMEWAEGRFSGSGFASEEKLRVARYHFFKKIVMDTDACLLLTAHTLDDLAETVLLRIMRGSIKGRLGFSRLRPLSSTKAFLARPFRGLLRADLRAWILRNEGKPFWLEDPSNQSFRFARNRIRHYHLPRLAAMYPDMEILSLLQKISEVHDSILDELEKEMEIPRQLIRQGKLLPLDFFSSVSKEEMGKKFYFLLRPFLDSSLNQRLLQALCSLVRGGKGRRIQMPGGLWAIRKKDGIFFEIET